MNDKKENNPNNNDTSTKKCNVNGSTGNTFSSTNQPSRECKQAGQDRWKALQSLKKDIFNELVKEDGIKEGMKHIRKNAKDGDTKELLDVLKIITPKDLNIDAKVESNTITEDKVKDIIKDMT